MRYARPAVYYERVDASAGEPLVLRTDIAAFVGIARRGPLDTAVPVESWRQFIAHFGDFTGAGYLAYAVRGFFENGGRRCWIVRVASRDVAGGANAAGVTLNDAAMEPSLHVAASSPGSWGNALAIEWVRESGVTAVGRPAASSALHAGVGSVAGFSRGTLVVIEQAGVPPVYRVLSAIDAAQSRLYWVHPEPGCGLPTDRPLGEVDPAQPIRISPVAYTLTVREAGRVRALYRDLHLVPGHPRYIADVLQAPDYRPWWLDPAATRRADLPRPAEPIVVTAVPTPPERIPLPLALIPELGLPLAGGTDGLSALQIDDFIGAPVAPGDSDFARALKTRGLQALADIDEIALLAMPDILIRPEPDPSYEPVSPPHPDPCVLCPAPGPAEKLHQPLPAGELPPAFGDADIARAQAALLADCEARGDRFAILSPPARIANEAASALEDILAWRRLFDSRYGALYAPWVEVLDPRRFAGTRRVPACGHVTGAIARTDLAAGVHRAPGNLTLDGVTDLPRLFRDDEHGELNLAGVDVLRGEFGRPPLLAGARTLSFDPAWRFINIARLVMTIRKAAAIALRWVVFEGNDRSTRAAVAASLGAILQLFFERGAFRGATPEESYFVRCDEVTTPPQARDDGQLIALVGIAPAAPCEFIVLRIGRERNALSVTLFGETEALHA